MQVEKRLAQKERAEQSLLREVIELRDALTTAERQRRDLGLLREHRASLEQQLEVSEQRLGQQAAQLATLRAREAEMEAQLARRGEASQRDCEQCEVRVRAVQGGSFGSLLCVGATFPPAWPQLWKVVLSSRDLRVVAERRRAAESAGGSGARPSPAP